MKSAKIKKKVLSLWMTLTLAFAMLAGVPAMTAYAATGNVYTCVINRCYAHPLTGVIEDSGGEASYATGQGMVEGCVYPTGILELTDDGAYYLTIRMSLMDYTSGHSFLVQNVGDSGWSSPSEIGVTGNGTDSNGATADVCMRVPSENCIVRGSMYVEPMGRDVIFYLYPSDYSAGNNTNMNATMVTGSADTTTSSGTTSSSSGSTTTNNSATTSSGSTTGNSSLTSSSGSATSNNSAATNGSTSSGNTALQSSTQTTENTTGTEAGTDTSAASAGQLQSSITEAAKPSSSSESSTLNNADGLTLSTAQNATGQNGTSGNGSQTSATVTVSSGSSAFQVGLAVTIAGLILIAVAAGVVYFFRRNWQRWGGAEDDEY